MVRRFVSEFQVYLKCSVVVVITALSLVRDAYRLFGHQRRYMKRLVIAVSRAGVIR